jgi:alkylation response protein AidB-like acyl-CoA dehydrogenase
MDFSFTDEQQMLQDTARRLIADRYTFDARNRARASKEGWSREVWSQFAELGLLAVNIPEEEGGIGAGPVGTMLICNAVGEGMLLEPFLSSAVVATHAIVGSASREQRAQWLPAMAGGELIAVLAHDELSSGLDPARVETTAVTTGDGWQISGQKSLVYHAPAAHLLLVTARVGGELGLFAIESGAGGVSLSPYATIDEQRAAGLVLDGVHVPGSARLGRDVRDAVQMASGYGLAALCAEAIGAMDRLLAATIAYSRSRVQFGRPIGTFQVLQHRMADMLICVEQARSMSYLATSSCTDLDPQSRRRSLAAAKVLIGQSARFIGQQAVQLHGGIGMTDELDVSHYFKRLLAFEMRCGTTQDHLEIYQRRLRVS